MTEWAPRDAKVSLIMGRAHVDVVLQAVRGARTSVWISTANLKDVHVEARVGTRARAAGRDRGSRPLH